MSNFPPDEAYKPGYCVWSTKEGQKCLSVGLYAEVDGEDAGHRGEVTLRWPSPDDYRETTRPTIIRFHSESFCLFKKLPEFFALLAELTNFEENDLQRDELIHCLQKMGFEKYN